MDTLAFAPAQHQRHKNFLTGSVAIHAFEELGVRRQLHEFRQTHRMQFRATGRTFVGVGQMIQCKFLQAGGVMAEPQFRTRPRAQPRGQRHANAGLIGNVDIHRESQRQHRQRQQHENNDKWPIVHSSASITRRSLVHEPAASL